MASGLSGECIRTGQTQRCDDAQADPRADAAASQRLGVRSVLVLPLIGGERVVGLFEVFSPRAWAFGDRDERTLEALAIRVTKNLERAAEPLESLVGGVVGNPIGSPVEGGIESRVVESPIIQRSIESRIEDPVWGPVDAVPAADLLADNLQPGWEASPVAVPDKPEFADVVSHDVASSEVVSSEVVSQFPGHRFDVVGWALGAVVLACTVLMVVLVVERMGPQDVGSTRTTGRRPAVRPTSAPSGSTTADVAASSAKAAAVPGRRIPAPATSPSASVPSAVSGHTHSAAPAGSLLVFENGKEVFRMPPSRAPAEPPATAQGAIEPASSVTAERVVALSPAAAENSLIHRVEPDYPEEARNQQLQGAVVLDIHIGQDGTVQETKLVSGEPLLADAAMAAVRQWRFQPRVVNGAPAEMQTRVTLNFRLSN